jgi:hypothetical protein
MPQPTRADKAQTETSERPIADQTGTHELCQPNLSQFIERCVSRNVEAFSRMARCASLPELLGVQLEWFQDMSGAWVKEASKVAVVQGGTTGCWPDPELLVRMSQAWQSGRRMFPWPGSEKPAQGPMPERTV